MSLFSRKTNHPTPPPSRAESEQTLQSIMNELNLELKRPSMRRSRYQAMYLRYFMPRILTVLMVVGLLVGALIFWFGISPIQDVEQQNLNAGTCRLSFNLNTPLLVSGISAQINEKPLPVLEADKHKYYIDITENGLLTLSAKSILGNSWTKKVTIDGLDGNAPRILEDFQVGDMIYIYLTDGEDGSGIDWENICAWETDSEEEYEMISYNDTEGYVIFPFPAEKIQIRIPDRNGNCLNASLTPKIPSQ